MKILYAFGLSVLLISPYVIFTYYGHQEHIQHQNTLEELKVCQEEAISRGLEFLNQLKQEDSHSKVDAICQYMEAFRAWEKSHIKNQD